MKELSGMDLEGFEVRALDGSLGHVVGTASPTCLVVKPGMLHKMHQIPAEAVQGVDPRHERVFVRMTKNEIRHAPRFKPRAERDPRRNREISSPDDISDRFPF